MTTTRDASGSAPRGHETQRLQEEEYRFPYHYLPRYRDGKFSCHEHWAWGFRYLAGTQLVTDLLAERQWGSLIDIGCGDGRLIAELAHRFPGRELAGVDYSERAIALARAMNPGGAYEAKDICAAPPARAFDAATLVEVLEHIEPARTPAFVAAVAAHVRPGGHLVVTVPHVNRPVERKHFRHFTSGDVAALFAPWFETEAVVPFDLLPERSLRLRLIAWVLGGRGRHWLVTNRRLLGACYRYFLRHFLRCEREADCARVALALRRRHEDRV